MRVCSFILAVLVMWFSILPQTTPLQTNSCDETACESACSNCNKESKHSSEDCCPNGICNPFQQCNCCALMITTQLVFSPKLAISNTEKHNAKPIASFVFSYSNSCFHPPEPTLV